MIQDSNQLSSTVTHLEPLVKKEQSKCIVTTFDCQEKIVSPTLMKLEQTLQTENRLLSPNDLGLVNNICAELANIYIHRGIDFFSQHFQNKINKIPGMMSRISLYESDSLIIRAHIFEEGAKETCIHDHGQSFITTCIQGGYLHQIWEVEEGGKHYVVSREPGGIFSKEDKQYDGSLKSTHNHDFQATQSMYLDASVKHTVSDGHGKLITIVVRDAMKTSPIARFFSNQSITVSPSESVVCEDNPKAIFQSFLNGLEDFSCLICQLEKKAYSIKKVTNSFVILHGDIRNSQLSTKIEKMIKINQVDNEFINMLTNELRCIDLSNILNNEIRSYHNNYKVERIFCLLNYLRLTLVTQLEYPDLIKFIAEVLSRLQSQKDRNSRGLVLWILTGDCHYFNALNFPNTKRFHGITSLNSVNGMNEVDILLNDRRLA